jgi:uncharacterized damage-inducible protein DinB
METTMIHTFIQLFERDLNKLEKEIQQYTDELLLWKTEEGITNPAGTLCLHLCGNLQHYIGARLGKSGYQRNRPAEFSLRDVSRAKLIREIQQTQSSVATALQKLDDDALQEIYPEEVFGYPMTTGFFLVHLYGHFGYHLGQINYHRRLIR